MCSKFLFCPSYFFFLVFPLFLFVLLWVYHSIGKKWSWRSWSNVGSESTKNSSGRTCCGVRPDELWVEKERGERRVGFLWKSGVASCGVLPPNCRLFHAVFIPRRNYPTLPSSETESNFCASTANSIGSLLMTSRAYPPTMRFTASSTGMPRCWQ